MKKMLMFLFWAGLTPLCYADVTDPFTFLQGNAVLAVTQHGSVVYSYGERGTKNVAVLDNIAEAVKVKNTYLLALDAGINGASGVQEGQSSFGYSVGVKLNIGAIVKGSFAIKPEWEFINSLSYGLRWGYESTLHHPQAALVIGYDFGPATK